METQRMASKLDKLSDDLRRLTDICARSLGRKRDVLPRADSSLEKLWAEVEVLRQQSQEGRRQTPALTVSYVAARSMRRSSIRIPDLNSFLTHLGCLPRPAQVSDPSGFRYFGSTLGYGRRARLSNCGRSLANRCSSSLFSALNFALRMASTFPRTSQSSSTVIPGKMLSICCIACSG